MKKFLIGGHYGWTTVGLFTGWFNGFTITRFNVPPFVATLAASPRFIKLRGNREKGD